MVAECHPHGDERNDDDETARILRGGGQPGGGAGDGKTQRALTLVRGQRQQQRQRDEKSLGDVGQHVVRLAHVERHHGHEPRGERRVPRSPAHPDAINQQHGQRPEERGYGASPEIEVAGFDLIERRPLAEGGADEKPDHRDAELQVEVKAGVVEEVRVEIPGPHHLEDARHDLGFVDAEIEGDTGSDGDESEQRRDRDDDRQDEDRRAYVACFAPLAFDHSCSLKR